MIELKIDNTLVTGEITSRPEKITWINFPNENLDMDVPIKVLPNIKVTITAPYGGISVGPEILRTSELRFYYHFRPNGWHSLSFTK